MLFSARFRAQAKIICLASLLAAPLTGCVSLALTTPLTEQINASLPSDESGLRRYSDELGRRYDSNPADRETVLAYAAVLRKLRQTA